MLKWVLAHGDIWQIICVFAFLVCVGLFRKWIVKPVRRYFRTKIDIHLKLLGDLLEHYFTVQEKRIGASWAINDTMKSIDANLAIVVNRLFDTEGKK